MAPCYFLWIILSNAGKQSRIIRNNNIIISELMPNKFGFHIPSQTSTLGSESTFLQSVPWQFPQAEMHFTLFFLQEHRCVAQLPLQLQLTKLSRLSGAIGSVIITGS